MIVGKQIMGFKFHLYILLVHLVCVGLDLASNDLRTCKRKSVADIVFVLDASASIHQEQFEQQLEFVDNVIDTFPISDDEIRVGLITFSYLVYPAFDLNTYTNTSSLKNGIHTARYAGEGTHTADAIKYTREIMFSKDHGRRITAQPIMIIVTDGISENKTATASEAKLAKLHGIKILVVGVGNGVDKIELHTMASDPPSRFIFNVDGYESLNSIIDILSRQACKESNQGVDQVIKVAQKHPKIHITFVYDEMDFNGKQSEDLRKSIALMVKKFTNSETKMTFSLLSRVDTTSPLKRSDFLNNLKIQKANISHWKQLLKSLFKTRTRSRRRLDISVVIAFHSGKQLQSMNVLNAFKRLSREFEFFLVIMSNNYKLHLKEKYFCAKKQNCVSTVNRDNSLQDILESIKQQICASERC